MDKLRMVGALIFAGLIGSLLGNATSPRTASATSLGVLVECTSVQSNQAGTQVTESCGAAPGDTSGLTNFIVQFTASSQRYPLNQTATLTLP